MREMTKIKTKKEETMQRRNEIQGKYRNTANSKTTERTREKPKNYRFQRSKEVEKRRKEKIDLKSSPIGTNEGSLKRKGRRKH